MISAMKKRDTDIESVSPTDSETERDEVKEVRRVAQKDTFNVKLWRFAMTSALLMTALAVTLTTYKFLKQDQYEAFKTAVSSQSITP